MQHATNFFSATSVLFFSTNNEFYFCKVQRSLRNNFRVKSVALAIVVDAGIERMYSKK